MAVIAAGERRAGRLANGEPGCRAAGLPCGRAAVRPGCRAAGLPCGRVAGLPCGRAAGSRAQVAAGPPRLLTPPASTTCPRGWRCPSGCGPAWARPTWRHGPSV